MRKSLHKHFSILEIFPSVRRGTMGIGMVIGTEATLSKDKNRYDG